MSADFVTPGPGAYRVEKVMSIGNPNAPYPANVQFSITGRPKTGGIFASGNEDTPGPIYDPDAKLKTSSTYTNHHGLTFRPRTGTWDPTFFTRDNPPPGKYYSHLSHMEKDPHIFPGDSSLSNSFALTDRFNPYNPELTIRSPRSQNLFNLFPASSSVTSLSRPGTRPGGLPGPAAGSTPSTAVTRLYSAAAGIERGALKASVSSSSVDMGATAGDNAGVSIPVGDAALASAAPRFATGGTETDALPETDKVQQGQTKMQKLLNNKESIMMIADRDPTIKQVKKKSIFGPDEEGDEEDGGGHGGGTGHGKQGNKKGGHGTHGRALTRISTDQFLFNEFKFAPLDSIVDGAAGVAEDARGAGGDVDEDQKGVAEDPAVGGDSDTDADVGVSLKQEALNSLNTTDLSAAEKLYLASSDSAALDTDGYPVPYPVVPDGGDIAEGSFKVDDMRMLAPPLSFPGGVIQMTAFGKDRTGAGRSSECRGSGLRPTTSHQGGDAMGAVGARRGGDDLSKGDRLASPPTNQQQRAVGRDYSSQGNYDHLPKANLDWVNPLVLVHPLPSEEVDGNTMVMRRQLSTAQMVSGRRQWLLQGQLSPPVSPANKSRTLADHGNSVSVSNRGGEECRGALSRIVQFADGRDRATKNKPVTAGWKSHRVRLGTSQRLARQAASPPSSGGVSRETLAEAVFGVDGMNWAQTQFNFVRDAQLRENTNHHFHHHYQQQQQQQHQQHPPSLQQEGADDGNAQSAAEADLREKGRAEVHRLARASLSSRLHELRPENESSDDEAENAVNYATNTASNARVWRKKTLLAEGTYRPVVPQLELGFGDSALIERQMRQVETSMQPTEFTSAILPLSAPPRHVSFKADGWPTNTHRAMLGIPTRELLDRYLPYTAKGLRPNLTNLASSFREQARVGGEKVEKLRFKEPIPTNWVRIKKESVTGKRMEKARVFRDVYQYHRGGGMKQNSSIDNRMISAEKYWPSASITLTLGRLKGPGRKNDAPEFSMARKLKRGGAMG